MWRKLADKAINQYVSGRLFGYLTGDAVVIWLALKDKLETTQTFQLLEILFIAYFGVKSIEWAGNAIKSITLKGGAATPTT